MNLLFDVLIFNKYASDGQTENPDFTCYQQIIQSQNWTETCTFDPTITTMILQQSDFEIDIKSLNDSNNMQRHVIIDNSPFPLIGGSIRKDTYQL